MKDKVEGEYNASQVSAVTQGLDGTPVVLIQVQAPAWLPHAAYTTAIHTFGSPHIWQVPAHGLH